MTVILVGYAFNFSEEYVTILFFVNICVVLNHPKCIPHRIAIFPPYEGVAFTEVVCEDGPVFDAFLHVF